MSTPVDRNRFYANFPSAKLAGKICTPARKTGFEAIFDAWDASPHLDYAEWLAYALATAWHETGARMVPVREGFAATDADAFARVTAYCAKHGKPNYAARDAHGHSFYGRGYVQLTHAYNYADMSTRLNMGTALVDDPDRVLDAEIGAKILLLGLMEGRFRPSAGRLGDYFNGQESRWTAARGLVNGDGGTIPPWAGGKSIGELVGGYGRAFVLALM